MSARLVVVAGTGTGIGKTHFAAALVTAWATAAAVAGIKPIETGVAPGDKAAGRGSDGLLLGRMSTFHVKQFQSPYLLARPVSPHLAAREEGITIDLAEIVSYARSAQAECEGVVLETAGGLFSPITERQTNADLIARLAPNVTLLVAPDRLGVLHDVVATIRAAFAAGLRLTGIVLSAPENTDASTGTNAAELARVLPSVPVLAVLPRASIEELSASPVAPLVGALFG